MLQKRFGGFGLRRITKFENVSQRHRIAFVRMSSRKSCVRPKRQETAGGERRTNAKRISVTNFVVGDHAANLSVAEFATVENGFALLPLRTFGAELNRTRQ